MKTSLTPADLAASVIAVPPLCRRADFASASEENARLISWLQAGGVRILLYGGNANFYNVSLAEYPGILDELAAAAGPDTVIIPSVGPYFGTLMDQAAFFKERNFPTAMVLPTQFPAKPEGVATAIRRFSDKAGIPVVIYIKNDGYTTVADVRQLVADGCVSWIKYAVVRPDERHDPFLRELVQAVDPNIIISGMGEQPVITHLRDFGLGGFTSGCVCVAPALSTAMLHACKAGDWTKAEALRQKFCDLEDLRNTHGPIPVLHEAVAAARIAETGPPLPLLADLPSEVKMQIHQAAMALKMANPSVP